jgi:uncharacterized surface protein with fasciclin (FAS1) repeats
MKKLIAGTALSLAATAAIAPVAEARQAAASPSIVEVALAVNAPGSPFAGAFDTLIAAVGCSPDIAGVLSQKGQYTVFAPTDDAFAELGLTAANVCSVPGLSGILAYHAANGRRDAADVVSSSQIRMLNGQFTEIDGATIDGQNIIVTDVPASNGIIHAIDGVLLPA